ncbi:hypothetical protein SEA_SKOG_48 [Gordonia phage Skog]|uniref:Uncharacterized protein n=1 Tax=Gordonia phage Skog TaxID=2704033 RepID=A0A6G6XKA9_9CAUD|nr:hypothetical protein KHQ85_gp048 [Gordonia phage Skog]QIG58200.1 hypothetical protein SEA_SKOG_48 [Gordonia phage Skog]
MSFDNPDPGYLEDEGGKRRLKPGDLVELIAPARMVYVNSGDPDQVEQVAQAIYEASSMPGEWEDLPQGFQGIYRRRAHAALVSLATRPEDTRWNGFRVAPHPNVPQGSSIPVPDELVLKTDSVLKWVEDIGDGETAVFEINHGIQGDVVLTIRDVDTGNAIWDGSYQVTKRSGSLTIRFFRNVPRKGELRVTVVG